MTLPDVDSRAPAWSETDLDSLCIEITVGHVGSMVTQYEDRGIPFLRSQNVEYLRLNLTDVKYIGPEFHRRLRKSRLQPGDVVIVRTGAPGTCAVIPDSLKEANCSDLVIVRCGPHLDPNFLAYYINSSAKHYVNAHLVGAVQQHFNVGSARTIRLRLPSIEEQRAIVAVLGALDDKIELNRKICATLEAIARALFKSWFVDFDPVRAKAEGRDPGLPAEIAALFPDSFANEGSRPIPMGWATARLDDFANISGGKQLPTHDCKKSGKHQVFGANGVMGYADRYTHDSFVAAFGRVGANCGSIHWTYEPSWINNNASAIAPERYPEYVLQTLLKIDFVSMRTGSAQPFIPNSSLAAAPILRAPNELISEFCSIARPMRLRQGILDAESLTLAALRDTLLPKLISGELRVGEADRVLAASA